MKRAKRLFDSLCSVPNLLEAAQRARRGKRFLTAPAVFHHNVERELIRLRDELQSGVYRPGAFRHFRINDPKPRLISAAPYRDRVVHHALCNIVEPIFEPTFIFDSYACRRGKGTHVAADRVTQYIRRADYALQCDVRRYFPSIDHAVLKQLIRRKIGCERTIKLIDLIIDHGDLEAEADNSGLEGLFAAAPIPKGLPIGNQTSQFFANVYLNALDHFVKGTLRQPYYVRYVDDFVILGDDKSELHRLRSEIDRFLRERLLLQLHPIKQRVYPVSDGVDFCGYRIFTDHRRLRRDNGIRFARRLKVMQRQYAAREIDIKKVQQRVMSWIGHASHADTWGLRTALFDAAVFSRA